MNLPTSYVLLGFRALRKDSVASLINVAGLSVAVACAVALFLLLQEINTSDDFHANGERLFLVGHTADAGAGPELWGTAPQPLGPALAADLPQVEQAVRVATHGAQVRAGTATYHETLSFADPGFFDVFTFPLAQGDGAALVRPGRRRPQRRDGPEVLRRPGPRGADAHGRPDPRRRRWAARAETLTVVGVAAPFDARADFRFDLLAGYDLQRAAGLADPDDWAAFTEATFLLLRRPDDAGAVAAQLGRYTAVQNAASADRPAASFFLDSVQHPDWRTAWQIEDRALQAPLVWESVMFGVIALLMLLVACFNTITISLGAAARRLREIGIRKTMGASRRELVVQFLVESLVLCSLAVLSGLVVAWAVTVPFLNGLLNRPTPLDIANVAAFWPVVAGLPLFLGLVAGLYPALYVSAFQPTEVLRGRARLAEKKGLTRALTVVQFTLALVTICLAFFTATLDDQLLGGDWGYDPADLLVVATAGPEQADWLRREASALPQVRQIAGAAHPVGSSGSAVTVRTEGQDQAAAHFSVGPDYLATLGIEATDGRAFGDGFADAGQSVVVNQTFAQERGWAEPVGQAVEFDGRTLSVVGVVEDVLLAPMAGAARPVVFSLADAAQVRSLTLRVDAGTADALDAALRARWGQQFPGAGFVAYAQADVFARESLGGVSRFISYLAGFALLISCMGLFGLASQGAARRTREVGVRKVLGASAAQIVFLVNRGFLAMLAVATGIATPLCVLGLGAVLRLAPVDLSLGAAPFVLANALVFGLAAVTLSVQTARLVHIRPADVLRRG